MIVHDLDLARPGLAGRPLETDAPLLIDANGILSGTISFERLEAVPRQGAERIERERRVDGNDR